MNINKALLTVSGIAAQSKVYDGTTSASVSGGSLSVVYGKDDVSVTGSGAFIDKNVGQNKQVNVTGLVLGGTDAGGVHHRLA